MIKMQDLSITYAGKRPVRALRQLNLSIERGEKVAIMGGSGCGKSTLLSVMAGLRLPTSGTYTCDGAAIAHLDRAGVGAFRDQMGIVFQDPRLLSHLTVRQNIYLAAEHRDQSADTEAEFERLVGRLGIRDLLDRKPGQLSGGQGQRAAIARALIKKPALLLADEPTSALDEETSRNVIDELLGDRQRTALIVTHNQELARSCDRVIRMRDGALAAS